MKKTLLLGTTALMAAGLAASGAAQAEESISAGIGGYAVQAIGTVSQENEDGQAADAQNSVVMGNDVVITVSGSTLLDNGITAGFSANIEGGGASQGALDDRFAYLKGEWGMIRIGQTESARQKMTTVAPNAAGIFGLNSPFFPIGVKGSGVANINTMDDGLGDDDAMKILYFSPSFNGFKVGLSYASSGGDNDFYSAAAGDVAGELQNHASVGLEYNGNFGDTALRLSGGIETYVLERCGATANLQGCDDNPDTMNFGATVSFGDFTVGGSWMHTDQVAASADGSNLDREDFDLGLKWSSGDLAMSMLYGEVEQDVADDTTDSLSLLELNMQYAIGPGIDLAAAVVRGEFDDGTEDVVGALDNSYTEIKAGVAMWF